MKKINSNKNKFKTGMIVEITHHFSNDTISQKGKVLSVRKGLVSVDSLNNIKSEKVLKASLFNQRGKEINKYPTMIIKR
jgi:hypothetical protein